MSSEAPAAGTLVATHNVLDAHMVSMFGRRLPGHVGEVVGKAPTYGVLLVRHGDCVPMPYTTEELAPLQPGSARLCVGGAFYAWHHGRWVPWP